MFKAQVKGIIYFTRNVITMKSYIKQEILYILCQLAELPELNPKYTKLSNLSDFWSKSKKYLPILLFLYSFFFILTLFAFKNNQTLLWVYLLIIYLYIVLLFGILISILESEKQFRERPRRKLIKAGREVGLDLEILEELKLIDQISTKEVIIEKIVKKVGLKSLKTIINCFENLEENLKDNIDKKLPIFLAILGFFTVELLIYFLNIPTEFLETKILNSTQGVEEILILFFTSILLYFNTRPSQTQQIYKQCLTVLREVKDKKDEDSYQRQSFLAPFINQVKFWFKKDKFRRNF